MWARLQTEHLNHELEARVQERTQATLALQADLLAAAQHQAAERALLYQVFEETPAAICIQRGPEHRYEYVNAAYQALFPERQFVGHTVTEALPETREGGIVALLDGVYQTGEPYFGFEVPLALQPTVAGEAPRLVYFTFTYQPAIVGPLLAARQQALTILHVSNGQPHSPADGRRAVYEVGQSGLTSVAETTPVHLVNHPNTAAGILQGAAELKADLLIVVARPQAGWAACFTAA